MDFKAVTFYVLYTLTAFFVFIWIAFPDQKAATLLSDKLNSLNNYVEVEIDKVNPGMMLSCKVDNSTININNEVKFILGFLKISPSFFSIFSDKKEADFEINNGKVTINSSYMAFKAKGNVIQINDLQTRGNILFSDIIPKINDIPILKTMEMAELKFDNISFEFIRDNDKIEILDFYARGTQCNIKVNGNIFFHQKAKKIGLDLKTNIQPNPSYLSKFAGIASVASLFDDEKGGIELIISGTLDNPEIKL